MSAGEAAPIEFPVEGISDDAIRLRLRADSDTASIIEACQDPEVVRWTRVPENYDGRAADDWVAESNLQRQRGEGLHLVIADASTDAFLGSVGIHRIDRAEGRCDIGYFLAPWARGRGAMTAAVRMLSEWIFETLPIERIEITVEPANGPSKAVAERAGYELEGILRSHTVIKGTRRDMAMYSLLRGELQ